MNTYLPFHQQRDSNFNVVGGSLKHKTKVVKYAIPTYKRIDFLKSHTLPLLESYNVPHNHIYLFLANKQELEDYKREIGGGYNFVEGVILLHKQRNFIVDYFDEGEHIVFLDDDIKEIVQKSGNKVSRLPNLKKFVEKAFGLLKDTDLFIWGCYPVNNGMFMKNTVSFDLRLLLGGFFGIVNRKDKDLKLNIEEKEDHLRTLLYWKKDGAVVRFNYIGLKTKFYNVGGMSLSRDRVAESRKAVEAIHNRFPNLTRIQKPTDKNQFFEVKIKRVPNEKGYNLLNKSQI